MRKSVFGDHYIGFSEDGYCIHCGTHYDNINSFKGCEKCIKIKYECESSSDERSES